MNIVTNVNCLVFNLSLLHSGNYGVHHYKVIGSETNRVITATQTNLAQSMYIFELLLAEEKIIDNAIVLLTDECLKDTGIDELKGVNTYNHYISEMKRFVNSNEKMKELILKKSNYSSIDEYFEKAFVQIKISGILDKELRKKTFEELQKSTLFTQSVQQNIYMDVTGGHRISSWLLMCISRIIEARENSEVKLALYGDILKRKDKASGKMVENPQIVDCTEAYKEFYTLENLSKSNDANCRYKALAKAGYVDQLDEEALMYLKKLDNLINKIGRKTKTSGLSELKETLENELKNDMIDTLDSFIQVIIKDNKANMEELISKNPFDKMMGFSDGDLINNFFESALNVFTENGVLLPDGRISNYKDDKDGAEQVKFAFLANQYYYKHFNKKGQYYGLVKTLKKWFEYLYKYDELDPLKYFDTMTQITNSYYKYEKWTGKPNPIRNEGAKAFTDYIENKKLDNYFKNINEMSDFKIIDIINSYSKMQTFFLSYGFPFECVNNQGYVFKEISSHYYNKVKNFMSTLSTQRGNKEEYKERLGELIAKEKNIEKEIPLATSLNLWKLNQSFFENEQEAENFLIEFNQRHEYVRRYRNAKAHDDDVKSDKSEVEVADEIREWLKKYSEIIEKAKSRGGRDE